MKLEKVGVLCLFVCLFVFEFYWVIWKISLKKASVEGFAFENE